MARDERKRGGGGEEEVGLKEAYEQGVALRQVGEGSGREETS